MYAKNMKFLLQFVGVRLRHTAYLQTIFLHFQEVQRYETKEAWHVGIQTMLSFVSCTNKFHSCVYAQPLNFSDRHCWLLYEGNNI